MMEDLYSMFTFEPFQNLHLRVSRISKSRLVHFLSYNVVYSHSFGRTANRKMLSSLNLSLMKARNGIQARVKVRYALSELFVNFARTEKRAQLNGLFTGGGL